MTSSAPIIRSVADYTLLGRSGLRVSPLCLGTMTFGTEWGWGSPKETAFALLDRYLGAGGNFVDTADGYTGGTSERIVGEYFKARGTRDSAVIATKFSFGAQVGDPNSGGNGRKNIRRALEGSLTRLGMDYVDVYWLHCWDCLTPIDEVMSTLDDLVREGKVRYLGLSDVPAWYAARAQTMAELRGWSSVIALQLEYSLLERNIEREHVPLALELDMGLCPWSPLGSGLLTGKYSGPDFVGEGRAAALKTSTNPGFTKLFTERNAAIVEAVTQHARELGRSPAQLALGWVAGRPGVASTIIGATKLSQLDDNLGALEVEIPDGVRSALDALTAIERVHPYIFFEDALQSMVRAGTRVRREPARFRG